MKKILLFCGLIIGLFSFKTVSAQSFIMEYPNDTITNINLSGNTEDFIHDTTSGNITITWAVIATNYPADWLAATGICDNHTCYSDGSLWTGSTGPAHTNNTFGTGSALPSDTSDFHLQENLTTANTPGCYYMTVSLRDASSGEIKYVTFMPCLFPASVPGVANDDDIRIYPNPAREELNVVYSAAANVKTIAVYNIIGKVLNVYRVSGDSANLNLENIPPGIYFVRLMNAYGGVVATRKFTRQ